MFTPIHISTSEKVRRLALPGYVVHRLIPTRVGNTISSLHNAINGPASLTTTLWTERGKLTLQFAGFKADHSDVAPAQLVNHLAV